MDQTRFEHIIKLYLTGKANAQEETELLLAIEESAERKAAFRERTAAWNPLEETADPAMDRKWERISAVIGQEGRQVAFPARRRWIALAAAAILALVSGISVYLLNQDRLFGPDWRTITAEGGDRSLVLPDGSSVYLREGSGLSYPETFSRSHRDTRIKGEAFFEVTPDSERPFIVDASGLSVTVLGTSFSVQTRGEGTDVSVVLVEGKVSLSTPCQKEPALLLPNQKAEYSSKDKQLAITDVDSERLTSWRRGVVSYDNASIEEIVRLIERTYKVTLSYGTPEEDDQRFSGAFLKTQDLETVLEQTRKLTGINIHQ